MTEAMADRKVDRSHMQVSDEVAIQISNMNKWYGTFHVLRDIDLTVNRGERIVIAGPSGSGKSTLIRCINRLEEHQAGQIIVDGTELTSDLKNIDKVRSEVGMVFQHFNLFPHLTILENLTLAPIWVRKTPKKEAEEVAMHYLNKVKIPEQAHKYPGQLSGGQQQRVALARAIVAEPPLVLFDEPLSNLDRELREGLALEIGALLRELGLSAIYVTHDQSEAFTIADRVAVMLGGEIAQIDTPEQIFACPASVQVAQFLNIGALVDGKVCAAHGFTCARDHLNLPSLAGQVPDGPARILIPRTAIRPDPEGALMAQVLRCQFQGDRYLLHLGLNGEGASLVCATDRPAPLHSSIPLAIDPERLRVFPH